MSSLAPLEFGIDDLFRIERQTRRQSFDNGDKAAAVRLSGSMEGQMSLWHRLDGV